MTSKVCAWFSTQTVSPAIETVKSVKIVRIGKLMENVKSFRMIGSVTNLLSKSAIYRTSDGEDHTSCTEGRYIDSCTPVLL